MERRFIWKHQTDDLQTAELEKENRGKFLLRHTEDAKQSADTAKRNSEKICGCR